jgi:transposase InsO family protein
LVLIDTFSGWVEAFPRKRETAQVVAKVLLEEIIPRYGIPETLGSDNGPAFISNVLQGLARAVGTNWKLHCEYNPQSSGQVERMNRTLKETLSKLAIETGGDWVALLPYAIFQVQNSPYVHGLTPFEILYGAPPLIVI